MAFGGENAESYYDEALTASMKGDLARAVACLEQAIRLDRNFMPAVHLLGKCYLRMGDGSRAAAILHEVVLKRPDQIPPRIDLGYAMLRMGEAAEAARQFKQVVALDPSNGRAQLGLAHVRMQEGDWQGALAVASAAGKCAGRNVSVLFTLGRAAKLAGDAIQAQTALEEADALLEKSVELNPHQPEGYYLRGEVAFVLDKVATALELFRAAEQRAEKGRTYTAFGESFIYPDILAKQGLCLQRLGRNEAARELGRRALEVDPAHKIGQALRYL